MKCSACGQENPAGYRFCGACGAPLEVACASCGTVNPATNRFCGACGQPLGLPVPTPVAAVVLPVPTATPASFGNGRYTVKRFLGEGGKKKVYLAHDGLLDRDVAFALIKAEGLDDIGRIRVQREAQAMGRLGSHPHVVSVFDLGEHEGQPFMVTELMGGGDVEGLIEKAPQQRVPLERAIRIADEVCRGLEFAHEQHIVHRDLKPGNVWLTADGTAKIGDFGLAVATDRSRLTQAGLMVGTVSYMPPEQALGGEVTPRSDLYSLGAMLYELVTGQPPFRGDESVAIITQHLNVPPVAPSWHNPQVSPALEALVLRLLEKDPARRPASATEVRAALAHLQTGAAPSNESGPPNAGPGEDGAALGGPSPLYRTVFVGREAELQQGQAAFDRALSGHGSVLLISGEPGIGKTALCEQLATYVGVRGGRTLIGHSYEEGSLSLPYLPFIEALRSYVQTRDPAGLRRDLGTGAADVARIVSEVRVRLGEGSAPPSDTADADQERWRLLQAVTDLLRNASAERPLLIVLEDLHWADRGSLDVLTHLARNLQGARLLLVGTYRDVDVDRAHPLSSALAELRRGSGFQRLLLRGLTAPEVQRMLGAIAGQEVAWGFAEAVFRQTEGNPLFVQEVARYLAEEGFVVREDGRWRAAGSTPLELHIPEGLREVIGKRLSRLSPVCNRVLSVAAVIGREFRLDTLQQVADLDEETILTALEEAIRVGVLQEEAQVGGARYQFAHAFFRQTLYEEMSVPRRLRLHQQVGRVLEEQYEERLEDHAAELADHFAHSSDARDLASAVAYAEIAAQRAISVNAYGEAVRHLEQALEIQTVLDPDAREQRCDLLLALGQALLPAGDPRRAYEEVAPEAFALAEALGNRGRAARACRVALEGLSRQTGMVNAQSVEVRPWAERASRYADEGTRLGVYADGAMSFAFQIDGDWAASRNLAERAYRLAQVLHDPECVIWSGTRLLRAINTPHRQTELKQLAQDLEGYPRAGVSSRTLELLLRFAPGYLFATGDRPRAERCWEDLDVLASLTQDANLLSWPSTHDAMRRVLSGDLEGALVAVQQTEADLAERGGPGPGLARLQRYLLLALGRSTRPEVESTSFRVQPQNAGERNTTRVRLRAQVDKTKRLDAADLPVTLLAGMLDESLAVGDEETSTHLATLLRPVVATSVNVYVLQNVARMRGDAATLSGDRAGASGAYQEGLIWAERIQHRPEIALSRLAIAELLLTGDEREQAEALTHLDFAIDELRAMKMQPALERALSHKGILKA